jgi:hypothetical protein
MIDGEGVAVTKPYQIKSKPSEEPLRTTEGDPREIKPPTET